MHKLTVASQYPTSQSITISHVTKHHNIPRHKASQYPHVTKHHNIPRHKASQYSMSQNITISPRYDASQYPASQSITISHVTKHHNISTWSRSITKIYLQSNDIFANTVAATILTRYREDKGRDEAHLRNEAFRASCRCFSARFLLTYNAGHDIPSPVIHRRELICRVKWKAEEEWAARVHRPRVAAWADARGG